MILVNLFQLQCLSHVLCCAVIISSELKIKVSNKCVEPIDVRCHNQLSLEPGHEWV